MTTALIVVVSILFWSVLGVVVVAMAAEKFETWKMRWRFLFCLFCGPIVWVIVIVMIVKFRRRL